MKVRSLLGGGPLLDPPPIIITAAPKMNPRPQLPPEIDAGCGHTCPAHEYDAALDSCLDCAAEIETRHFYREGGK